MARKSSPRLASRPVAKRLVPDKSAPASARRWRDPVTGATYSNRQRQQGLDRGLTIEQAKLVREAGRFATVQRAIVRGVPWDDALDRAKAATGKSKRALLSDPEFYAAVRGTTRGKVSRRDRAARYFGLDPDDFPSDWNVSPEVTDFPRAA